MTAKAAVPDRDHPLLERRDVENLQDAARNLNKSVALLRTSIRDLIDIGKQILAELRAQRDGTEPIAATASAGGVVERRKAKRA